MEFFGRKTKNEPWPAGIPKYKESDLLQGKELLSFAMKIVKQNELDPNGYTIVEAAEQFDKIPNYVCKKDGKILFIIVKVAIAPEETRMTVEEKKCILEHARQFGAKCFFAPMVIGSSDPERFEASLVLKNDGFLIKYTGLEEITFKKTTEWIKNALEEIKKLDSSTKIDKKDDGQYSKKHAGPAVKHGKKVDDGIGYICKIPETEDFGLWKKAVKTESFQEMLLRCIETKGLSNQEFYTAALIDRKLFSAIKNNQNYQPKKETAVACCLGLGLNWQDAEKLLELAGYKLSLSISWDRVIYYCFHHGITDIDVVNELLYEEGAKCIRV